MVSQMLTYLGTSQIFGAIDQEPPGLDSQAEELAATTVQRLRATQNMDGGWSWWPTGQTDRSSDPFISAYVMIGLARLRDAGAVVPDDVISKAVRFMQATVFSPQLATQTWQFNRLAFQNYALVLAGHADPAALAALYEIRALIGPWGRAFLSLGLEAASPGDSRARTLMADLETEASRTGKGAYWPLTEPEGQNMSTAVLNTAVVTYAIAERDPASRILPEAVQYLIAARQRDGDWGSSFETAWALQALLSVLRGTGELGGSFSFGATLNNSPLAGEELSGNLFVAPISVRVPLEDLRPDAPNELRISRAEGNGRLYYWIHFRQDVPVDRAYAVARGIAVDRVFHQTGESCISGDCPPLRSGRAGEIVTVRLTVTLAEDAYYVRVEDHLPAGAEFLNLNLQTSRQGAVADLFDPRDPFGDGFGWWYFGEPQIYDDAIVWTADFVPAGTYELVYQLVLLQPGEYRILPAIAGPEYFPEIFGQSSGAIFEIEPEGGN